MPGKSRRVASRQAQLNQRRKRQQRGPRGIPTDITPPRPENGQPSDDVAAQAMESTAAVAASPQPSPSAPAERSSPVTRPVGNPRARRETVSAGNYIGAELRRILVMASVVFGVIIVLAIVR